MNKLLRNESGYSIVLVFFIVILVSVLGLTLMSMNTQSLTLSNHEREDQAIFYLAESGLTYEKAEINNLILDVYEITKEEFKEDLKQNKREEDAKYINSYLDKVEILINNRYKNDEDKKGQSFNNFGASYKKKPQAVITAKVFREDDSLRIALESTGYFTENESNSRTVSQSIIVSTKLKFLDNIEGESPNDGDTNLPKLAVQAKGDISLDGSATIHGSAATSNGKIEFLNGGGDTNITGFIGSKYKPIAESWFIEQKKIMERHIIPNLTEINLPPFPTEKMDSLASLPPLADEFTNNQTINLTKDTKFKDSVFKRGATTNLNIDNNTINLFVENFITSDHSTINIIGSGKLNIFVKNSFEISGSSSINLNGDANNLNIYYAGSSKFSIGGLTPIVGSFFAKESDIDMSSGGSKSVPAIAGNITTGGKNVIIGGGNNNTGKYIIAPNAHVQFNQDFSGIVICDTFTATGSSQIRYAPSVVPPPFPPDLQPDYSDPDEDLFEEKDLIEK